MAYPVIWTYNPKWQPSKTALWNFRLLNKNGSLGVDPPEKNKRWFNRRLKRERSWYSAITQ